MDDNGEKILLSIIIFAVFLVVILGTHHTAGTPSTRPITPKPTTPPTEATTPKPTTPTAADTDYIYLETVYDIKQGDYVFNHINDENGKITGLQAKVYDRRKTQYENIPDYISGFAVISLNDCFNGCQNLTTPPTIPSTVKTMRQTFMGCFALTTAPTIPNGVENMDGTFFMCNHLTTPPALPSTVKNLNSTFANCLKLTTAPTIPNGVETMNYTFNECRSLTTAPTIPSTVKTINGIYHNCFNLTGNVEINTNPTESRAWANGTLKEIIITGTTTMKKYLSKGQSNNLIKY